MEVRHGDTASHAQTVPGTLFRQDVGGRGGREVAWGYSPRNDDTIMMPPIVVPPLGTPPLVDLALHHGMAPAGTRPSLREYTRMVWRYRHFTAAYANAKIAVSFQKARLGRLWQILTPITNATVYYLVFGVLLNTRANVPNFIGYLCAGLFIFTFTQTVVLGGVQSISGQLGLVRALHFPRAC